MKDYSLKISNGEYVTLTESDMDRIHRYYTVHSTADYIQENYPDLSEEVVLKIATDVREEMNNCGYGEDEAIQLVMKKYGY